MSVVNASVGMSPQFRNFQGGKRPSSSIHCTLFFRGSCGPALVLLPVMVHCIYWKDDNYAVLPRCNTNGQTLTNCQHYTRTYSRSLPVSRLVSDREDVILAKRTGSAKNVLARLALVTLPIPPHSGFNLIALLYAFAALLCDVCAFPGNLYAAWSANMMRSQATTLATWVRRLRTSLRGYEGA